MIAGHRLKINEAALPHSSDDGSILFKTSTDSMMSILSYLNIKSICRIDMAVTNTAGRMAWLISLRMTSHRSISEHKHGHESIRWPCLCSLIDR